MTNYVYNETFWYEDDGSKHYLYTVGFYTPDGRWIPASDHSLEADAINRTAFLNGNGFDFISFIHRQYQFSQTTFGPGERVKGIIKHIRKELREVKKKSDDVFEWCDIILLAIDGALRQGYSPSQIAQALTDKLNENESREWPDWRNIPDDQAIEHLRSKE